MATDARRPAVGITCGFVTGDPTGCGATASGKRVLLMTLVPALRVSSGVCVDQFGGLPKKSRDTPVSPPRSSKFGLKPTRYIRDYRGKKRWLKQECLGGTPIVRPRLPTKTHDSSKRCHRSRLASVHLQDPRKTLLQLIQREPVCLMKELLIEFPDHIQNLTLCQLLTRPHQSQRKRIDAGDQRWLQVGTIEKSGAKVLLIPPELCTAAWT